jgi:Spy/CpxP family protein refolding chaperone
MSRRLLALLALLAGLALSARAAMAQDSSAAPMRQGGGAGAGMGGGRELAALLHLTPDQIQQARALRQSMGGGRDSASRAEYATKFRALLTPAQAATLDSLRAARRMRMRGDGAAPQ